MCVTGPKLKFHFQILRFDFFPAYLVSTLQDLVNANRLKAQLQFALRYTGHVEQIVN